MNFSGLSKAVEEALSFKVRNADPRQAPNYPQILYTWYVSRSDFRSGKLAPRFMNASWAPDCPPKAAMTMYMCSQKLSEVRREPGDDIDVLEQELEALTTAINALSLVEPTSAWFSYPTLSRTIREVCAPLYVSSLLLLTLSTIASQTTQIEWLYSRVQVLNWFAQYRCS